MPFSSRRTDALPNLPYDLDPTAGRRRVERIVRGFCLVLAACALVGGYIVAGIVYDAASSARAHQVADRTQVTATLLDSSASHGRGNASEPLVSTQQVPARWTAPDGHTTTGLIAVDADASAGDHRTLWVDSSGDLVAPPLGEAQVVFLAIAAGVGVDAAAIAGFYGLSRGTQHLVARRRWRAMDTEWAELEPQWSARYR